MKILDTVVLASALDRKDPRHARGRNHLFSVITDEEVFVPSVCVIELDLVAKANGVKELQRAKINDKLATLIARDKILPVTPSMVARACKLATKARWRSKYFDMLIAAAALEHSAEIITTDRKFENLGITINW